jgi:hypothetical protein
MVPGLFNIPSIGSKPTCRAGSTIVRDSLGAQLNSSNSAQFLPSRSPPRNKDIQIKIGQQNPYDFGNRQSPSEGRNPSQPQSPSRGFGSVGGSLDRKGVTGYSHIGGYNPITNPIPNTQQNPYIKRITQHY